LIFSDFPIPPSEFQFIGRFVLDSSIELDITKSCMS